MMAVSLPTHSSKLVKVAVRSSEGTFLGEGVLYGSDQVRFLRDQLEIVSSFHVLSSPAARLSGWDLLLQEHGGTFDSEANTQRWTEDVRAVRPGQKN